MMLDGLLTINKPSGMTSHDVVDRVRRILRMRRIGHTGVLDPSATGVLPLCLGRATRLARFLINQRKTYEGTFHFGWATNTYDADGKRVGEASKPDFTAEQLEAEAGRFRGEIEQIPPMFSAKKVKGQRLYQLAYKGEEIERDPVSVKVFDFQLGEFDGSCCSFTMTCSSGTYVRSVAHDMGQRLGCGAFLENLCRTSVGELQITDAVALDGLTAEEARDRCMPMEAIPLGFPKIAITEDGLILLKNGQCIDRAVISEAPDMSQFKGSMVRLCGPDGRLVALAEKKAALFFQPRVVLL